MIYPSIPSVPISVVVLWQARIGLSSHVCPGENIGPFADDACSKASCCAQWGWCGLGLPSWFGGLPSWFAMQGAVPGTFISLLYVLWHLRGCFGIKEGRSCASLVPQVATVIRSMMQTKVPAVSFLWPSNPYDQESKWNEGSVAGRSQVSVFAKVKL